MSNALTKVSTEVARRNIDKPTTIRALLEDSKDKDTEIKCLKEEKEITEVKARIVLSMADQIGDEILKARPNLEEKVLEKFPSVVHYLHTLVHMVMDGGPVCMPKPKDFVAHEEKEKATIMRKITSYESVLYTMKD